MRNFTYILLAFSIIMGCSLEEDTISSNPNLGLIFSNDTVAFDTLLSDSRSSTQRLKVINPNSEAIRFSSIFLGLGDDSEYSVVINGRETNTLTNQVLVGGDSLLILVEVNVSPRDEDLPYLVKDSIVFDWNTNTEHVKLVTYGQDGNKRENEVICNETWTSDRPYIISDTLLVGAGCELVIEKGARIYFENDAGLFIQGSMIAVGDSADHIEFTNARFDGGYDNVPGQWNGIYFLEGSTGNEVRYADIFNGQVGLRVGTPDDDTEPDIYVANTSIYNMSVAGLLAFTSDVEMTNTLIYNCGTYLVGNFAGGNYTYQHCTFSNEPSLFIQDEAVVQIADNIITGDDEILTADLSLVLENSIIWGTADDELLINNGGGSDVFLRLSSNIIRSSQEIENNYTSLEFNFPGFKDPFLFDYSLDTLAFAKDVGADIGIEDDIEGNLRDVNPDIGAYERIEK